MKELKFKRFSTLARAPIRFLKGAAGYDLFSNETKVIKEHGCESIKTDIEMKIPEGTYGQIASRSSLNLKHQITIGSGAIGPDFVCEAKMILFNHSSKPYEVHFGDPIAHINFERVYFSKVVEVSELPITERVDKAFGSNEK